MSAPSITQQVKSLSAHKKGFDNPDYRSVYCLGYAECQQDTLPISASADARIERLEKALRDLVKCNEDHNADMLKVLGNPWNWNDSYLDAAREALSNTPKKH